MPDVSHAADDFRRRLGSAEVRAVLERFVRRRVPAGEVEDVVQTVLVDALEAPEPPEDEASLRRWVMGIARHKVADFHRKKSRGKTVELPEQIAGEEPPISAREWARWAEKQAEGDPDAKRTLDWMAREGGGEKLAHIAEDEKLPRTLVRQRVSRMRRRLKEQWKAELAAVAIVLALALVAWRLLREPAPEMVSPDPDRVTPTPDDTPPIAPIPVEPTPLERASELRRLALADCAEARWQTCLDQLDAARELDPAGDLAEDVQRARSEAERALSPDDEKKAPPSKLEQKPQPTIPKPSDLDKESLYQQKKNAFPSDEPPLEKKPPPKKEPPAKQEPPAEDPPVEKEPPLQKESSLAPPPDPPAQEIPAPQEEVVPQQKPIGKKGKR